MAYHQLIARGLASGEAANLVGYLHGLPAAGQPWTLSEVMNLVFLRELYRAGRFESTGDVAAAVLSDG